MSKQHKLSTILLLLAGIAIGSQAVAAGDAKKGADAFAEECGDCHSAKEGKAKKGPPLFGVINRKAGSVPEFAYSDAMKQSGITWTSDKIDAYITAPRKVVPGGKMKYDGLGDAGERADIIAYLMGLHRYSGTKKPKPLIVSGVPAFAPFQAGIGQGRWKPLNPISQRLE